jgi:hypothetical protein
MGTDGVWPNFSDYRSRCLVGLSKSRKILSQDSRYAGQRLNPNSPNYGVNIQIATFDEKSQFYINLVKNAIQLSLLFSV